MCVCVAVTGWAGRAVAVVGVVIGAVVAGRRRHAHGRGARARAAPAPGLRARQDQVSE